MSDMIRASLDQAFLAVTAADDGELETAAVRASVAQALATIAVGSTPTPAALGGGARAGGGRSGVDTEAVYARWRDDLTSLGTVELPDVTDDAIDDEPLAPRVRPGQARRADKRAARAEK